MTDKPHTFEKTEDIEETEPVNGFRNYRPTGIIHYLVDGVEVTKEEYERLGGK